MKTRKSELPLPAELSWNEVSEAEYDNKETLILGVGTDENWSDREDCIVAMCRCFSWHAANWTWHDVCERHWRLFEALHWRDTHERSVRNKPGTKLRRAYWATISTFLRLHKQDRARSGLQDVKHLAHGGHLPMYIITELEILAGFLSAGVLPGGLTSRGRPEANPDEVKLIGAAVAYRLACSPKGLSLNGQHFSVDDHAPVQTLMTWFGAKKRTVQDWSKNFLPMLPIVQAPPDPTWIARHAKTAGLDYQDRGRSLRAVDRRVRRKRGAAKQAT